MVCVTVTVLGNGARGSWWQFCRPGARTLKNTFGKKSPRRRRHRDFLAHVVTLVRVRRLLLADAPQFAHDAKAITFIFFGSCTTQNQERF